MLRLPNKPIDINTVLESLKGVKRDQIAFIVAAIFGYEAFCFVCRHRQNSVRVLVGKLMKRFRGLPGVRGKVGEELDKVGAMFEKEMNYGAEKLGQPYVKLPRQGFTRDQVLELVKKYGSATKHFDWQNGMISGTVYADVKDNDLLELQKQVFAETCWSNPLHADIFGDVRRMEAEVVKMCISLFNGDSQCCGTMTSGGTESLLLACKTYRDRAIALGLDPENLELVMPISAHAAFWKASQLMRFKLKTTPVNIATGRADVDALRRAITRNTFMIVGSAPNFPYGSIDDIPALSKIAASRNIPLHVDSCLGGFVIPFAAEAGFSLTPFDFRVPGVTSISCDTHKYAGAPKGSSVVMYRSAELRQYQYFVTTDWSGGIYASPTLAGSRAGSTIATCWASMLYNGHDRYVAMTKRIFETARSIKTELQKIKGVQVIGEVDTCIVAFAAANNAFNVYSLQEAMSKRGWNLNALQFPSAIHIAVTVSHTRDGVAQRFVRDVEECVSKIEASPNGKVSEAAAFYGSSQLLPDRSIVNDVATRFLDACYSLKA